VSEVIINGYQMPAHACSFSIIHNEHLDCYETVKDYVDGIADRAGGDMYDWESPESKQRCIDTGELWEMRWYPRNPITFSLIGAPTLDELLKFADKLARETAK
jgi:hypothetical protein